MGPESEKRAEASPALSAPGLKDCLFWILPLSSLQPRIPVGWVPPPPAVVSLLELEVGPSSQQSRTRKKGDYEVPVSLRPHPPCPHTYPARQVPGDTSLLYTKGTLGIPQAVYKQCPPAQICTSPRAPPRSRNLGVILAATSQISNWSRVLQIQPLPAPPSMLLCLQGQGI